MNNNINERWSKIPNYEKFYMASNLGRIKSIGRWVNTCGDGKRYVEERIMKPQKRPDGYLMVGLSKNNKTTSKTIHRLVLTSFLDQPPKKEFVNHIDGNKKNNKLSNLEWVDKSENAKHSFRLGLSKPTRGELSGVSKLKEKDVLDIKRRALSGELAKSISNDYNISNATVYQIKNGKRWAHINVI